LQPALKCPLPSIYAIVIDSGAIDSSPRHIAGASACHVRLHTRLVSTGFYGVPYRHNNWYDKWRFCFCDQIHSLIPDLPFLSPSPAYSYCRVLLQLPAITTRRYGTRPGSCL